MPYSEPFSVVGRANLGRVPLSPNIDEEEGLNFSNTTFYHTLNPGRASHTHRDRDESQRTKSVHTTHSPHGSIDTGANGNPSAFNVSNSVATFPKLLVNPSDSHVEADCEATDVYGLKDCINPTANNNTSSDPHLGNTNLGIGSMQLNKCCNSRSDSSGPDPPISLHNTVNAVQTSANSNDESQAKQDVHSMDNSPPTEGPHRVTPSALSQFEQKSLLKALATHPRDINIQTLLQQSHRIKTIWPDTTLDARQSHPGFCELYQRIKAFNLPNFLGAKIVLKSDLDLDQWDSYLSQYHDKEVVSFLRYGWPIGYNADEPPESVNSNHSSANQNSNMSTSLLVRS